MILVTGSLLLGCLDSYSPPADLQSAEGLVVEGFLNATDHSIRVVVSHTTPLDNTEPPLPESGAIVSLQSDRGESLSVAEVQPGIYERSGFNINMEARYQLRVAISDGRQLHSEYVEVRQAPPIDNLALAYDKDGVVVRVNTHDPNGNSRYYRWDYVETWEYTSAFRSDYNLVNKQPTPRRPEESVYRCWRTEASSKIMIASSLRLAEDIISDQPIFRIPIGDQRLSIRYSVLAQQRAITRSEYDYLFQLRQSTENVGSLFDPQPSQVRGNVTRVDGPATLVLGFFSAGTITTKRIFQSFNDLPDNYRVLPSKGSCSQDTVCISIPNEWNLNCSIELKELSGTELITGSLFRDFATIGFLKTTVDCGDCRQQGGVTSPPEFW
jgi:hypothetical protein